jgi:hypothetical protein
VDVPGLSISSSDPMLGTSLDGIVDCSICGPFIIPSQKYRQIVLFIKLC